MNSPDATAEVAVDADFADALTSFIADEVALEDYPVAGDTDLLLTGLVDSLGVVMIVNWIEATLGTTIDPADVVLEHFQTIDQMLSYLRTA
jgi:acyl carrier protein